MSNTISVRTSSEKHYEYHTGIDLTDQIRAFVRRYPAEKVFVMVDAFVLEHHKERIEAALQEHFRKIHLFEVPRGESSKNFQMFQSALDFILREGVERGTPLVAVGGGVTGDLAGFVAASVLRGIPLIQIPTTLLAMVDSSIGGKTGINHAVGKNLVGSFYQPDAVFADVRYLQTLEPKEWVNGLSEVLKYGMIRSPEILSEVDQLLKKDLFQSGEDWIPLIHKSASIKVDIVNEDVLEAGIRAYLNFGHTFGHVLERVGRYTKYSHGEAVFAGMIAATIASNARGANIEMSNLLRFKSLYEFTLDTIEESPDELVEHMRKDKKVKNEHIQLILLQEEGVPYIHKVEDPGFVVSAWNQTLNLFS